MSKVQSEFPKLNIPRNEASEKISARIAKGRELLGYNITNWTDLEHARTEKRIWSDYNRDLLGTMFSNSYFADEYSRFYGAVIGSDTSLALEVVEFRDDTKDKIARLESIFERLELITENSSSNPRISRADHNNSRQIFVVHGHDEAARESLARFLEKLGLVAVILHERRNAGRTIIEKFEQEAATIGFAIVLLTPDDLGTSADKPDKLQPRARQNAILELGYFIGRLGRERVCALHKGNLEIPSDILGVVYVPMDANGGWRLQLGRELKTAKFEIDLN